MKKINWKTEKRKIEELRPWEKNPRKFNEKQKIRLKESLEKFNLAEPIIINKDGTVIGGHFRLKVLKEMGVGEVDVRVPDRLLNEKEVEELNLRLNKNLGEWDWDLLANFNEELLKNVGFEDEELDEIFNLEIDEKLDVEKELEKVLENKEKRCKEGDLWQLGEHRLYIGDATKKESWEKVLKDEKVADLILTDPPYFTLGSSSGKKPTVAEWGLVKPFWEDFLTNSFNYLRIGRGIFIFCDWRTLPVLSIEFNKYFEQKNLIVVVGPMKMGNGVFRFSHELIIYGLRTKFKINEREYLTRRRGIKLWKIKDRNISDVWYIEKDKSRSNKKLHSSMKPLNILKTAIEHCSNRGEIVVDCFGGSGSTLIACEILKRKCRMIEINPFYGEVIINRWEKFTNLKAEKIN